MTHDILLASFRAWMAGPVAWAEFQAAALEGLADSAVEVVGIERRVYGEASAGAVARMVKAVGEWEDAVARLELARGDARAIVTSGVEA